MSPEKAKKVAQAIRDLVKAQAEYSDYQNTPHRQICGAGSSYAHRVDYCQKQIEKVLSDER